ncbi:hypothetical protein PybrP1_002630, partial [[Pythium] brassicae (nom. inval.)]
AVDTFYFHCVQQQDALDAGFRADLPIEDFNENTKGPLGGGAGGSALGAPVKSGFDVPVGQQAEGHVYSTIDENHFKRTA